MKELFEFDDTRTKEKINDEYGLSDKITQAFTYLEGKLPQNKVTKTLRNLKTRKGKSYEYYMFKDKDVSILVRQYQRHFTIYTYYRPKDKIQAYFHRKISVFTMFDNGEKMTEDGWNEDTLETLRKKLTDIVKLVKERKVHCVWNSYSFEVPKYTECKVIYDGESVYNLELLIFAVDEVAQLSLELFAENEMLEKIKTFKIGDKFGEVKEIVEVRSEVPDGYYHAVGLKTKRIDEFGILHEKEPKWDDVYSLTRWYYDEVFPEKLIENEASI